MVYSSGGYLGLGTCFNFGSDFL